MYDGKSTLVFSSPMNASDKLCQSITILDDFIFESNERFSINLSSSDPTVKIPNNVLVMIIDNSDGEFIENYNLNC